MDYLDRLDRIGNSSALDAFTLQSCFSNVLFVLFTYDDIDKSVQKDAEILVERFGFQDRWLQMLANGNLNKAEDLRYEVIKEFCREQIEDIEKCMHQRIE